MGAIGKDAIGKDAMGKARCWRITLSEDINMALMMNKNLLSISDLWHESQLEGSAQGLVNSIVASEDEGVCDCGVKFNIMDTLSAGLDESADLGIGFTQRDGCEDCYG